MAGTLAAGGGDEGGGGGELGAGGSEGAVLEAVCDAPPQPISIAKKMMRKNDESVATRERGLRFISFVTCL